MVELYGEESEPELAQQACIFSLTFQDLKRKMSAEYEAYWQYISGEVYELMLACQKSYNFGDRKCLCTNSPLCSLLNPNLCSSAF